MPRLRTGIIYATVLLSAVLLAAAPHSPQPNVVAYVFVRDAPLLPGAIDAPSLTRINYAFANIQNGQMVTGFASDAANFAYLAGLRKQNPSLTVLVSVGGWLWSTNFSDISLTHTSRRVFIRSVMQFLDRYDLDGLDIDWEYPGMVGAGHPFRTEDKQNFTLLLKELRSEFDKEARRTSRRLYLTIAAGASDEFLAHTEMNKVQKYVDTVNLMAYDYYEPDSDLITGHHAPLFTNPDDPKKVSGDASVQAFEKAGVPAAKILLGMPFYGHVWGDVPDKNHGLFQPGVKLPNAYASYDVVTSGMLNQGFVRYWDPVASVPYLYNADKKIFVSYEDTESIAAKCRYVLEHRLGGVMFWSYSNDSTGALLGAINGTFRGRPSQRESAK